MRWDVEEHPDFGELHVLEGRRTLATVRQDDNVKHTVVTVSILLPHGQADLGKQAAEKLMSTAIGIEREHNL